MVFPGGLRLLDTLPDRPPVLVEGRDSVLVIGSYLVLAAPLLIRNICIPFWAFFVFVEHPTKSHVVDAFRRRSQHKLAARELSPQMFLEECGRVPRLVILDDTYSPSTPS